MTNNPDAKPAQLSEKARKGELDGEVDPVDAQEENQKEMESGRNLDGLPLKRGPRKSHSVGKPKP